MANPGIKELAMEAMIVINAAIRNIRLYPPASNLITNSIDRAYSGILSILEQEASMVLAESEKSLLVCGESLSEKDQKKPQAAAVIDIKLIGHLHGATICTGKYKQILIAVVVKIRPRGAMPVETC